MILNQKLIKIIVSKRHRKWGNLEVAVKQVSTERRGFNTLLRNFSKENLSEVFAIQQFGQSKTCPIKCCCCFDNHDYDNDDDDDHEDENEDDVGLHLHEGHCSGKLETEKTFLPQCSKQRMWGSKDSNPERRKK